MGVKIVKAVYDIDLKHIKVVDNREPLVNIEDICNDIKVDLEPENRKFFGKNICFVRKSVAVKLSNIQKNLKGMKLVICDGYRPIELQKRMWDKFYNEVKKKHPKWSSSKLHKECSKFIAPVVKGVVTPHSTGGAVDITIEKSGKGVDMGTKLGELSLRSATSSTKVSESARKNRMLLAGLMKKEGFVNYPLEWWHWSYGDRTWVYYKKAKFSFYNAIQYNEEKWK